MAKQSINTLQRKENTAKYYGYQSTAMTTTSSTYVNFTPTINITTTGGAVAIELFVPALMSGGTGFMAVNLNGVDYELATVSNITYAVGYWGKAKTPALAAGTYTAQLRGKTNGGATITVPAYLNVTIFLTEVNAG